jgi:hypothetical protein
MVLRSARWLGGGTDTGLSLGDVLDTPEPRILLRRLMAQVSNRHQKVSTIDIYRTDESAVALAGGVTSAYIVVPPGISGSAPSAHAAALAPLDTDMASHSSGCWQSSIWKCAPSLPPCPCRMMLATSRYWYWAAIASSWSLNPLTKKERRKFVVIVVAAETEREKLQGKEQRTKTKNQTRQN